MVISMLSTIHVQNDKIAAMHSGPHFQENISFWSQSPFLTVFILIHSNSAEANECSFTQFLSFFPLRCTQKVSVEFLEAGDACCQGQNPADNQMWS